MLKTLTLLGSTGSIGKNAVKAARRLGLEVRALAAFRSVREMEAEAREFLPRVAALYDIDAARDLRTRLADTSVKVVGGEEGVLEAAAVEADCCLNAIVGVAGLRPTLAALGAVKRLALANKETLVCAGSGVLRAARERGVEIIPVDSEHSAIFQCLQGAPHPRRILLTASGGPFFGRTSEDLEGVTVADALSHPNWSMGAKITVDSATLMNKGLELIEAMHLFGVKRENIKIIVQRESIIHSAVEFEDGAVVAQLGIPDMSIPIQYALTYPGRADTETPPLELEKIGLLSFSVPDRNTFKCLALAERAADAGGAACAALNAANEVAVGRFLAGKLSFPGIAETVERLSEGYSGDASPERALEIDAEVRSRAAGGRG